MASTTRGGSEQRRPGAGTVRQPYGSHSRAMLARLRAEGLLKVEAFVAWLAARGIRVDRSLVSHWCAGRSHLPADLLPLLARFSGRPDAVFGEFVRAVEWEVVPIPPGAPADHDLVDLMFQAGSAIGRLQRALFEARMPTSPGGVAVTAEERAGLRARLDELIQLLADLRARLASESAPPPAQSR